MLLNDQKKPILYVLFIEKIIIKVQTKGSMNYVIRVTDGIRPI